MISGYYATFELVGKNCKGVTIVQSGGSPLYGRTQRTLNNEIQWLAGLLKHNGGGRKMANIRKFKVTEL